MTNLWAGALHATTRTALDLSQFATGLLGQPESGVPAAPGGGAAPAPGGSGPAWMSWVFMLGIFALFYFMVLRPQQKRANAHKKFIEELKEGARVVTTGGIYGKIVKLEGNDARLEIADKVTIRVHKSHIAGAEANAAEALASQQR